MIDLKQDLQAATIGNKELSDRVLLAFGCRQATITPNVTVDINAALELVPEDRKFWHVSSFPDGEGGVEYEMWLYSNKGDNPVTVYGKTLALAICLAVLETVE